MPFGPLMQVRDDSFQQAEFCKDRRRAALRCLFQQKTDANSLEFELLSCKDLRSVLHNFIRTWSSADSSWHVPIKS